MRRNGEAQRPFESFRPFGCSLAAITSNRFEAANSLAFESTGGGPQTWCWEDRRIAYVAMSRARCQLHLTYTEQSSDGDVAVPSRFLAEIPAECVEKTEQLDATLVQTQQPRQQAQQQAQQQRPQQQQTQPQRQTHQPRPQQRPQQQQQPRGGGGGNPRAQPAPAVRPLPPVEYEERDEEPPPRRRARHTASGPGGQISLDSMLPEHAARAAQLEQADRAWQDGLNRVEAGAPARAAARAATRAGAGAGASSQQAQARAPLGGSLDNASHETLARQDALYRKRGREDSAGGGAADAYDGWHRG